MDRESAYAQDRDRRIDQGIAIEEAKNHRGVKLLLERFEAERLRAMKECLRFSKTSDAGINWRSVLSTWDSIFAIIDSFSAEKANALREIEMEKQMEAQMYPEGVPKE